MHFCGDFVHDILINGLVVLAFYPIWLPFGVKIQNWVRQHRH